MLALSPDKIESRDRAMPSSLVPETKVMAGVEVLSRRFARDRRGLFLVPS